MVEPLKAAAAEAAAEVEACLADDLLLLDFSSGGSGGGGGEPEHQFLLDLLDQTDITAVDSTPGLQTEGGGGEAAAEEEEEEELEWLSNKDAFPSLETSFEIPGHSRSSSGGSGSWCSAAAASAVLVATRPFWVSVRARSKGRRRTSRVLPVFPPAGEAVRRGNKRKCRHCEAEETPQWRAGPDGPKTLCNACGVRYNSGRLMPEYRPASSPTFSALLHSNSHRQILEMRRRGSARGRRSSRLPSLLAAAGSLL